MKIFVYVQTTLDEEKVGYINLLFDILRTNQTDVYITGRFSKEFKEFTGISTEFKTLSNYDEFKVLEPDLLITMGGDGTILRAITLLRELPIPVLSINLGRLGFLSSIEKTLIEKAMDQFFNKEYTIVERSVLNVTSNIPIFTDFPFGLNDFTLAKRDNSSMITIHTYIDDYLLNSYWSDGIIISTPTGSTSYSLSCGGPIVFPDSNNFVITPIAPHNLNMRPIVISGDKKITLEVEGRSDSFMCTLDSRYEVITPNHKIDIIKGDFSIKFVLLDGQNFMKTLSEKMLWGIDKRN